MAELKEKLFSDFPQVTPEAWKEKIVADLKGADFEKKLVWRTNEGFNVNPFYTAEDIEGMKTTESLPGEFPYVRGTKKDNDWKVRQNVEVKCIEAANKEALDCLSRGADSLGFQIKADDVTADNIAKLLTGINPEVVELNFKTCNRKSVELITILVNYIKASGYDVLKCFGSVDYDPFKKMLVKGKENAEWVAESKVVVEAAQALPRFRVLSVNAVNFNNAGSYITQELGYALAWGNEMIAKLNEAGCPVDTVAKKIKFNFGIGANYFMEIAKFRAARWLWAEIVAAY
ncbi:MAG: methylmalonyl-CoA mutase family protein, partial [Tannerellaceae bacterium]